MEELKSGILTKSENSTGMPQLLCFILTIFTDPVKLGGGILCDFKRSPSLPL